MEVAVTVSVRVKAGKEELEGNANCLTLTRAHEHVAAREFENAPMQWARARAYAKLACVERASPCEWARGARVLDLSTKYAGLKVRVTLTVCAHR